jgi:hypothetical protein
MEASVTQNNHAFFKLPNEPLKLGPKVFSG